MIAKVTLSQDGTSFYVTGENYQQMAHDAVTKARSKGVLIPSKECDFCKWPDRLHAHHHQGYDPPNWLKVIWLCPSCHVYTHKGQGQIRRMVV